jgi:hypothetical protein
MLQSNDHAAHLFDVVASAHMKRADVGRKAMFGCDGLRAGRRFYAFLRGDRLVLKLPPEEAGRLVAAGDAEVATAVSPSMRRWVLLSVPITAMDSSDLRHLLAAALAFAAESPATTGSGTGSPERLRRMPNRRLAPRNHVDAS